MTDELKPCPWCNSLPYFSDGEFSDGRAQVWCSKGRPKCPIGGIAMTPEQWNTRADQAKPCPDELVERVAYSVANAKLGEGPSVRCEGPTAFEIGVAREWTRRVLKALECHRAALTALPEIEEMREALEEIAARDWHGGPRSRRLGWAGKRARAALTGESAS